MIQLNIRQIMDCSFTLCHSHDTVKAAIQKMISDQTSYAIIADEKSIYQGVLTAGALLQTKDFELLVEQVMQDAEPLNEDGSIADIRPSLLEIIPVVNHIKTVVGVISIRSAFQYLPEALSSLDTGRSSGFRRTPQLSAKYTINDIVGQSKPILLMKEQIIAAAKTRSTVMVLGETGTGKELAAHSIHRLSSRRHNAFVRVNCAAIPDNLLESELFGYEAGAFTGAVKGGQVGKFEAADGGTIFLDEIGDMPLTLQSKILRVLQEKEIEKVGGRAPIAIDVRIIAATHRNLRELVREQKFREDLYYRLHVIPIQMPPLREHREDIPMLVDFFLTKQAEELGIDRPDTDRDFMAALIEYDWPGNVRELANIIELAISMSHGTITKDLLPPSMLPELFSYRSDDEAAVLRSYTEEAEKEAIIKALEIYGGNKIKVCDSLGISRSSLYNKLKKYDIDA
ncbi:sigma 54-interacting transcriptional regulator [Anaerosporomusa subterranea]|nr:sigma 54-interacting transcriptional regulator [Anaerosporomusa subterranea]